MEITTNTQRAWEKTVKDLREQLDQDTRLLKFLPPGSVTYDRLAARVEQQTAQLLDYERQIDRQRRAAEREALERNRQQAQNEARLGGGVMILFGAVVTYTGWGSWWLVLGILLLASGLLALFGKDI